MAQAYDFALDKIGMDIHSYSIWNDYVMFLKSVEAVGSYAENQKISAVRKVIRQSTFEYFILQKRNKFNIFMNYFKIILDEYYIIGLSTRSY